MNFKSDAAYKAWLAYGHASGEFAKTPGNQPVSIKGKSHGVQHAFGGEMYAAGGSFNNPGFAKLPKDVQAKIKARSFASGGPMAQLTEFTEGGRHEENPIGGIPQGFAPDGQPNLVEQGETKLNSDDYIYSDTLKVTKDIALDFSLPKNYIGKTFAEVSKEANRPKSRRENDTIETVAIKRDLDNLMQAQEEFKKRDLEKDMQMMMEKHPQEMQQMMAGAQGAPQGMPQEGMATGQEMQGPPQEMAPEQQVPQSAEMGMPQGQPMDPSQMSPEMLAQMEGAQQGMPVMRMGGNIYMCGGKMYDFGGSMYANGGHMYNPGGPLLGGATTGTNSYGLDNPWATNNPNPMYDMMHQYDVNPTAANPMMDLNAPLNTTPTIPIEGTGSDLAGSLGSGIGIATSLGQGAMGVANIAQQEGLSNKQKGEQYAQTGVDAAVGVANTFLPGISTVYGIQKGLGNFADKLGSKGDELVTSADGKTSATRSNKEGAQALGDAFSSMVNPMQSISQGVGYLADKNYKQAALSVIPFGSAINKSIERKEENKRADEIDRMNRGPQVSTLGMAVDDRTNPVSNPYSIYSKKYGGMQYAMGGAPEFGNPAAAAMLNKNPGRSTFGANYNIGAKPPGGPGGGALASRSDSLAVSNNARAVHDFYRNDGYERNKVGIGKEGNMYELHNLGSTPWKTLDQAHKNMQDRTAGKKTVRPSPMVSTKELPIIKGYGKEYTNINQYHKDNPNNPNQFWQREVNSGVLNLDAPMTFYDKRIEPQTWSNYSHYSSGDNVRMPQYDPIAVAPWDTIKDNPKDVEYRIKNFGWSGVPPSVPGHPDNPNTKTKSSNIGKPQQPVVEPTTEPVVEKPLTPADIDARLNEEFMNSKEPMVDVNAEQFSFRPVQEHMYNAEGQKLGNRAVDTDEVRRRFAMGENNPAFSPYDSSYNDGTTMNPARQFFTQTDAEGNKFYVGTDGKALTQRNDMLGQSELIAGANPTNPQYIDQRYEGDPYAGAATLESQKYFGAGDYPALPETPGFVPSTNQRPNLSNLTPRERAPIVNQLLQNNMQEYNNQMDVTKAYQGQYPIMQPKPAGSFAMGGFLNSDFSMYSDEAHSYTTGGKFEGDPVKGETRVTEDGYTEMYNGTEWEIVNPAEVDPDSLISPELLAKEEQDRQDFIDEELAKELNSGKLTTEYERELHSQDEKLKDKNLDLEMNQSLPEFLSGAAPAAYNLGQGVFGKVEKLNPDDYRVKNDMKPYQYNIEPQLRSADRTYAQGQDAVRNAGLSGGNYASNMQQLANSRNQEISDLYAQKQNQDAASYNQAMAQNKAIEAENLQRRMGIEDFNRQSKAAKTNMLQAGLQQMAQVSEGSQSKKMQLALMKALAPDFAGTLSYNNIMDQYLNKVKKKKSSKTTKD